MRCKITSEYFTNLLLSYYICSRRIISIFRIDILKFYVFLDIHTCLFSSFSYIISIIVKKKLLSVFVNRYFLITYFTLILFPWFFFFLITVSLLMIFFYFVLIDTRNIIIIIIIIANIVIILFMLSSIYLFLSLSRWWSYLF